MPILQIALGMHLLNNSWDPSAAPAHVGVSNTELVELAAAGGASIIRVPVALSDVGLDGPPRWSIDYFAEILVAAEANAIKVIFEPGQTPLDLLPPGSSVSDEPATAQATNELAKRFATLVETVHTALPHHAGSIAGWEVGNEPNLSYQFYGDTTYHGAEGDPAAPRFWAVGQENARYYAEYLAATADAVAEVEERLGYDVTLMAAGIAHNDRAYMDRMFSRLRELDAKIDAFAIHPYTFYDWPDPQSGRPTDWIPTPDGTGSNDWNYYHSFQGALYSIQELASRWGYGDSDLYITEFGVPSFLGYRSAGPARRIDQANWYAEAFGVMDAWGNDNLKAVIAHMVLDNQTADVNDRYNAYDDDPDTPDGGAISASEGAFALYKRLYAGGPVAAKPAVAVMRAIADGVDFSTSEFRVISHVSTDSVDVSDRGTNGVGLADGYIILTHDGDDTITGSPYDDSLFAGDGNDTVHGGAGSDRIYGGRGNDVLIGGDGDDDIYGNHGDDRIEAGAGTNRVDGGPGLDTLVLDGSAGDFTVIGDGRSFTVTALTGWQITTALNVEQVHYTADDTTVTLPNGDTSAGNGSLPGRE